MLVGVTLFLVVRPVAQFVTALKCLRFIEREDLIRAGIKMDATRWQTFKSNPSLWLIRANDADAAALWGVIQDQQPKEPG